TPGGTSAGACPPDQVELGSSAPEGASGRAGIARPFELSGSAGRTGERGCPASAPSEIDLPGDRRERWKGPLECCITIPLKKLELGTICDKILKLCAARTSSRPTTSTAGGTRSGTTPTIAPTERSSRPRPDAGIARRET